MRGSKGDKAYCILGFRVPTTTVGARGEGAKGGKAYCILGFRVPPPLWGQGVRGQGGVKGQRGGQRGAKHIVY